MTDPFAGDVEALFIALDEVEERGIAYRFNCIQLLRDGRSIRTRFNDMDAIVAFIDEFAPDNYFIKQDQNAEALTEEFETARRKRGALH